MKRFYINLLLFFILLFKVEASIIFQDKKYFHIRNVVYNLSEEEALKENLEPTDFYDNLKRLAFLDLILYLNIKDVKYSINSIDSKIESFSVSNIIINETDKTKSISMNVVFYRDLINEAINSKDEKKINENITGYNTIYFRVGTLTREYKKLIGFFEKFKLNFLAIDLDNELVNFKIDKLNKAVLMQIAKENGLDFSIEPDGSFLIN